ncbi:YqzM family protein [Fictibacillus sp. WQ 8-8]|uniref:YqzM family protein n=1 Tax=Fictibacillus marinisediminis TaxID=2878389 RepID=A0A9X1XCV0_9BACL|nr:MULTISPECIES: YqzM family protein [Fictibacillus]SFD67284.1 YqzM-like protein [Bacillus sp. OV194]MCK6257776.1 YqzM family protein [Fictibacillus marinisediminis]MCQ6266291.1 YqzM family protein [Fictibacillus sp. WQ 8-8]MED2972490.1 YqzM family protein [Fictibacillus sp. B-59209]UZJ80584.1 YqzM family protein [Fictibacillus sp. KU28468]
MNHFEKDVQSKRNDLIDSGMGFVWSFGFFTLIFAIGVIIKLIAT